MFMELESMAILVMVIILVLFGTLAICYAYGTILEREWNRIYKERREFQNKYYAEKDRLCDAHNKYINALWAERRVVEEKEEAMKNAHNLEMRRLARVLRHRAESAAQFWGTDYHTERQKQDKAFKEIMGYLPLSNLIRD